MSKELCYFFLTHQVVGFSQCAVPARLLALHPCPHATVSWSPMVGGTQQYNNEHCIWLQAHNNGKLWTCEFCDYTHHSKGVMRLHRNAHTKPFLCEFCSKTFPSQIDLKRHRYTHTGQYTTQCDKCEVWYSVWYSVWYTDTHTQASIAHSVTHAHRSVY